MKENDIKETFDKINLTDEKKNELANKIITNGAVLPQKSKRYRSRGKQAIILVTSLLLVYAVVFAALPLLDYQGDESKCLSESKDTSSKNITTMQNDSFESNSVVNNEQSNVVSTEEISDVSKDENTASSEPEQDDWLTLLDMKQSDKFNQPSTYVVTSVEQLQKIGQKPSDATNSGSFFDTDLSLYDETYFKSKFLIITYFRSGYAAFRYEINLVLTEYETEDIILSVVQTYPNDPEIILLPVCGFNCFITEWNGEYTGQTIRFENYTPDIIDENKDINSLDIYYGLSTFKGIEIYIWENDGTVFCGIMAGTNRLKSAEEIENLKKYPATLEQMRVILKTYDIPKDYIQIASNTSSISNDDIYSALDIR